MLKYCADCDKLLIEIVQGKVRKGTKLLCQDCYDRLKTAEDSLAWDHKVRQNSASDMPDFFKDIFKGKYD